jgi:hypothetical protein
VRERRAAIAEDRAHRRQSAFGLVGRVDADVDGVYFGEAGGQLVHHRGGQGRHRACAAGDEQVRRLGVGIERADPADELAAVRQVDVVGAGRDAGAPDFVSLALKRTAGVDHRIGAAGADPAGEARLGDVDAQCAEALARAAPIERTGQRLCRRQVPATDDRMDQRIARQALRQPGAEQAVTADQQHAERRAGTVFMPRFFLRHDASCGWR